MNKRQWRSVFRLAMKMSQPHSFKEGNADQRPKDRSEIASRFIKFRKDNFFSQARLARLISISRQTVSEIENSRVLVRQTTWERFFDLEKRHKEGAKIQIRSDWNKALAELSLK